jgi:diguanylate cyclase (GGDEF)-like protein
LELRRFEEYEGGLHLPSPAGVGCAILRCSAGDSLRIDRLVAALRVDPASTARVVDAANRLAGVGARLTVASAAEALHPRHLHELAVSFHSRGQRRGAGREFDHDRYWRWSLACAVAAEQIAAKGGDFDPEEAHAAALVSRIGVLALASAEPAGFDALLRDHATRPVQELLAAEARAFDFDHYELAASLMLGWGWPEWMALAVRDLGLPARHAAVLPARSCAFASILRQAGSLACDIVEAAPQPGDRSQRRTRVYEARGSGPMLRDDSLHWSTMRRLRELADALDDPHAPSRMVPDAVAKLGAESMHGIKVLAVDDDPVDLRLLVAHLEREGCEVLQARDGHEALDLALRHRPQAVVADWTMPNMSGSELCRRLRELAPHQSLFLVLLTGLDDEGRAIEAYESGADEYVTKPCNPRLLSARLKSGLRLARHQEAGAARREEQRAEDRRIELHAKRMAGLAAIDQLTGLPSRSRALELLRRHWDHAQSSGVPLAIALFDLDHFKRVNDEHGHDAGDEVLRVVARLLQRHARKGDILARFGGEEFLLVCPGAGAGSAQIAAERLRGALVAEPIVRAGFHGRLTLSCGIAEKGPGMLGVDALLKAADEALYRAKGEGRNRVRRAS